jgi:integrase
MSSSKSEKSSAEPASAVVPALATVPVLDPHRLDDAARAAAEELLKEGESPNTRRAYQSALRYWAAWYMARYGQRIRLPVPPAVVVQYLLDHIARTRRSELVTELPKALDEALVKAKIKGHLGPPALNTVEHRLAVLSKLHQLKRQPNPCEDPAVRQLFKRARRAYARRGALPRPKAAATKDPLEAMLATCGDDLAGIRDRAVLLFAWSSGGRRRSEVATARVERLHRTKDGYIYKMGHSKTNQIAKSNSKIHPDKPILDNAANALKKWLDTAEIRSGAIFRRLWGERIGPALSPAAIGEIVKRRARQAGLEGDWAGHSLRSGFITEAGKQGVALGDIMAMTDHTNIDSVVGYYQAGASGINPAARLLASINKVDPP